MKTKIEKNYCYTGLGFPIELEQVEMVLIGTEWHPKIDVRKVAEMAIKQLATKESPLTGDEVRFIRAHFGMSLRDFADNVVHETHPAVKKWEDKKEQPTKMNPNTEFVIRHYIIENTSTQSEKKSKYFTRATLAKKFYDQKPQNKTMMHVSLCA